MCSKCVKCSLSSTVRFYLTTTIAFIVGIGVGLLMVFYSVTEYEVLFTTANITVTLAVLYNQHDFGNDKMPKKQWQINMGLVEGYDMNSKTHKIEDIHDSMKKWIIMRKKINLPILSGSVQQETMIYPYDNNAILEPSAVIKGELSPKFDKYRKDNEVVNTLKSLASFLLVMYGQTRVYYSYCDIQYTIDKKDIMASVDLNDIDLNNPDDINNQVTVIKSILF